MAWVISIILSFVILEGLTLLLFPDMVREWIQEISPRALALAGLFESLAGAVLLYIYFIFLK